MSFLTKVRLLSKSNRDAIECPACVFSRSLLFENSGRYSAAAGLSSIPKLPFTKTGRLGGSNQDLGEEQEEEEDAEDAMECLVAPVRSNSGAGTGGSASCDQASSAAPAGSVCADFVPHSKVE